jgi:hypothetical protein
MDITNKALPSRYDSAEPLQNILKHSITHFSTFNTYTIAGEAIRVPDVTMSIIYSTFSSTEAQKTITNMPAMAEESDKERQQSYGKDGAWETSVDEDELGQFVKAETTWEGERCVKIWLNKRNTCWYVVETVTCEEPRDDETDSEVDAWDEATCGGDRKRVKSRVVKAKAREYEYGDVEMETT